MTDHLNAGAAMTPPAPRLSVVIVAYNIERELPRSLYTLSAQYQRHIAPRDFEIIVVDNGSHKPVNEAIWQNWQHWPGQFRLLRIDQANPSPADAVNQGIAAARGEYIGVMIDGARMCSPGLLHHALAGCQLHPRAVVGALGWYLGHDYQRQSMLAGYGQAQEDALLESIDWKRDGYALYSISAMDESSADGWHVPVAEFNAIFMHRIHWAELEGFDPRFDLPGGGLVNLDLCKRALEAPGAQCVLLQGEATFHQYHGGTATNSLLPQALLDWDRWSDQYQAIRGAAYSPPKPQQPTVYLGLLPQAMRLHYLRALAHPSQPLGRAQHPLGADFNPQHWAMPDQLWNQPNDTPLQKEICRLLLHALQRESYTELASACRFLRRRLPQWQPPLHLLSLVGSWLPHGDDRAQTPDSTSAPALVRDLAAVLDGKRPCSQVQPLAIQPPPGGKSHTQTPAASQPPDNAHPMPSVAPFPIHPAALLEPHHLTHPAPWAGHIPFAAWLVAVQQPRSLVELGTYSGISYLSFCQAIQQQGLSTQAFAVDTWEGDAHAGAYGETIYLNIRRAHDPHYTAFSTLLRMTFDAALVHFSPASVDLLHIDGLHTYQAVKHDFDTWLPKLSDRGVVLFHDTNVYRDDFGVHQLWAELSERYPSLHFPHSNGLGVLLVGPQQPPELLALCSPSQRQAQDSARAWFGTLGARLEHRAELLMLNIKLQDAQHLAAHLRQAGDQRHQWIEHLDQQILMLQRHQTQAKQLAQQQSAQLAQVQQLTHQQSAQLAQAKAELQSVYTSRSWRLTTGLRAAGQLARRARRATGYLVRGEWRALVARVKALRRQAVLAQKQSKAPESLSKVGIMATPHTQFVAHALAHALQKAGIEAHTMFEPPEEGFLLDAYFVLCPQMFPRLPPGEKCIAFQMEQSVSSRWFTPQYLDTLEKSLLVIDYAQANLQYLEKKGIGYPHTFLLPIGGLSDYREQRQQELPPAKTDEPCEVIFYGDVNAPRRQQLLEAIGERYQLRTVGDLFGPELHRALCSARVVVNLHYYEGALLETTRIQECLSLGLPVVSETSADQAEHTALQSAVHFVPVGDEAALLQAIGLVLSASEEQRQAAQREREASVKTSQAHFEFMLYRMLLAQRWLSYPQFQVLTRALPPPGPRVALSLPETTQRRAMFMSHQASGVAVFDGLRYHPGWAGCALSYKYLAQQALAAQWPQLEIMEDDVVFPADYPERKAAVEAHLSRRAGQWDVFVGLIAVIHPDTQVMAVERESGETFVTINRMMSTVHNTYAPSALQLLAQWDEANQDPETNTIDRFLQTQQQLRVVTTLPFLVGHHEELYSSLWGFQNTQYNTLIAQAQAELQAKVAAFEDPAAAAQPR